jgi:hypothetical protein
LTPGYWSCKSWWVQCVSILFIAHNESFYFSR